MLFLDETSEVFEVYGKQKKGNASDSTNGGPTDAPLDWQSIRTWPASERRTTRNNPLSLSLSRHCATTIDYRLYHILYSSRIALIRSNCGNVPCNKLANSSIVRNYICTFNQIKYPFVQRIICWKLQLKKLLFHQIFTIFKTKVLTHCTLTIEILYVKYIYIYKRRIS